MKDLVSFFKEHQIELKLKNVKFNSDNEITSISIIIKQGTNISEYASSSNLPIPDIELGLKKGSLFVTTKSNSMFAFSNGNINMSFQKMPQLDSLLQHHNFSFDFDPSDLQDGMININEMLQEMMKNHQNGSATILPKRFNLLPKQGKYHFVDSPDIEKLIIIDGKEADFETLDKLANEDQLDSVDFLKSKTAISLYGNKAKDGAIIATTKK